MIFKCRTCGKKESIAANIKCEKCDPALAAAAGLTPVYPKPVVYMQTRWDSKDLDPVDDDSAETQPQARQN